MRKISPIVGYIHSIDVGYPEDTFNLPRISMVFLCVFFWKCQHLLTVSVLLKYLSISIGVHFIILLLLRQFLDEILIHSIYSNISINTRHITGPWTGSLGGVVCTSRFCQVGVFVPYGLVNRPSECLSIRTIPLSRWMDRLSRYRLIPSQDIPYCMDEKSDHVFRGIASPPPL